jgi:hypothetical protein
VEQSGAAWRWCPTTEIEGTMPHREGDRIVETATEARSGVTGHNVRYVLTIGTAALVVLFAGTYLYFFA